MLIIHKQIMTRDQEHIETQKVSLMLGRVF